MATNREPGFKTSDLDYELPERFIATRPADRRDESRLMVLRRETGTIAHHRFYELPELLKEGDCLVINDSRVIPARLFGRRETGGRCEILLLAPDGEHRWRVMARPARKLKPGEALEILDRAGEPAARALLEGNHSGERILHFEPGVHLDLLLERAGHIPLPPYIVAARKRIGFQGPESEDRQRYQTVYAQQEGSVAAPTAGLHFTTELLERLRGRGIEIAPLTLHVGLGTFLPVKTSDPRRHVIHSEWFRIDSASAGAIESARVDPARRVVAVGTTVVRALESLIRSDGAIIAAEKTTDLMILPGFRFRAVDTLITNFHLPRSTLLMLVAALAGREFILRAYEAAIAEDYRFYSYGDAMLIE